MSITLYVFFEDPFWAGMFFKTEGDTTTCCRIIFGEEPTDTVIYGYILNRFNDLEFTALDKTIPLPFDPIAAVNPKRRQRQAGKALRNRINSKHSYDLIKQSLISSSRKTKRQTRQTQISEKKKH